MIPKTLSTLVAVCMPMLATSSEAVPSGLDPIQLAVNHYQKMELGQGHISVGIVRDGQKQVYFSDPGLNSAAVYEIGSISKTITALLTAHAVDQKQLDTGMALSDLLSDWSMPKPVAAITLEQLLRHESGLPRLPSNLGRDANDPYANYSMEMLRDYLKSARLGKAGKQTYSNLGYGVLGVALATSQKSNYAALLQQMSKDLGMTHTRISANKHDLKGFDQAGNPTAPWHFTEAMVGAGGIYSSVEDLLIYLQLLLNDNEQTAQKALPWKKANQRVFEGRKAKGSQQPWAWQVIDDGENSLFWHNGGTGGFFSFIAFAPKRKYGVVVLANQAVSVDRLGLTLMAPEMDEAVADLVKSLDQENPPIDPLAIAKISGQYHFGGGFTMEVFERNDLLYTQMIGQPPFRLRSADNPLTFKVTEVDARLEFSKNNKGEVSQVKLKQNGQVSKADKVR